jgi:hypothetical protein
MTGYEAFGLYESLKLHFTKDTYDYFKYNGKINISVQSFENRKDKYFFYKLSRKYTNKEDLIDFLVANFIQNEKVWIGNLLSEDADVAYRQRQKTIQSLSYTFENDCRKMFEELDNPNVALATNGDYPMLLTKTLRKEITFESLCLLNVILKFLPMWENKIDDTIRWPEYRRKIVKYTAFLPQDNVKYKLILKKVIT